MSRIAPIEAAAACPCHGLSRSAAAAVADELTELTGALSDLAYDLGQDPATVRRHIGSLQAIDLITQIHVALADFLRSEASIADRISSVPVEDLSGRLAYRLGYADQMPEGGSSSGAVEHF